MAFDWSCCAGPEPDRHYDNHQGLSNFRSMNHLDTTCTIHGKRESERMQHPWRAAAACAHLLYLQVRPALVAAEVEEEVLRANAQHRALLQVPATEKWVQVMGWKQGEKFCNEGSRSHASASKIS